MRRKIYITIYILCLAITVYIFGNFQKDLIVLGFNNEKIYGEITNIESIYRPGGGSFNRIIYSFKYNEEKYNRSFNRSTGGLGGIINGLLMNRHYRIGQRILILYNSDLKFSYVRDGLLLRIISLFVLIILTPFIVLVIIIGIKSIIIEFLQKIKLKYLIYKNKIIFYEQDNNYRIKESIINGIFDYKKLILKRLIEKTIICYGLKKGNNFIEISYSNSSYILRIYKNGKEVEIVCDENIKEMLKEYVKGL
ncbi:MAG: hypothetical protein FWD26_04920 [Treponema sp.]|nr:hypothetical protein [Treponema sp.]